MKLKKILAAVSAAVVMSAGSVNNVSATYPDPNGDGMINVADSIYIQMYLLGQINPTSLTVLDFNGNGIITFADSYTVECYSAGIIS